MASIISADSGLITGVPGLKTSADSTGSLQFQTGNNVTVVTLTSNGGIAFGTSNTAYGTSGQVLISGGNSPPAWTTFSPLPSQTGNANTFLKTNGTTASWSTLPSTLYVLNRAGSSISIPVGNGLLPVLNHVGSTINVPVS